jgi:phytoene dehydrogenase-like protein
MQIHIALDEPPRWREESLGTAGVVNVTPGLDGMSIQNGQAQAGLLPSEPTFMVGTPTLLDPSRAPDGKAILWIQLQETPFSPRTDAAGEIPIDEPGWTEDVAEAYADRVCSLLAKHIVNLDSATLARAVVTPAQLAARNINCVEGDPYAGSCDLDQSYLFRPLPSFGSHETPVDGLWMVGASTFPGPGLSGASGRLVATELLGRRASRRGPRRAGVR